MPNTPAPASTSTAAPASLIDSRQAAWRLLTTLGLVVLGNSSMYVVSVVLPAVQAEFGVGRADASLPYTLMMVCLGLGGLWTGRMADRHGLMPVLCVGAVAVCGGFVWAGLSGSIWIFGLAHGLMGLIGASATFAPLLADTALWWNKRRGIAVAICASGNYIAGALWPPIVQHGIETIGWRHTYVLMGLVCGAGMLLLALRMRQRAPLVLMDVSASTSSSASVPASPSAALSAPSPLAGGAAVDVGAAAAPSSLSLSSSSTATAAPAPSVPSAVDRSRPFGLRPVYAQLLLCVAGVACCVAMAMPQVHIVAYCTDLGFGAARGAEMLSLMLACGIVSRLVSGVICDRIGGVRTLLLGSALQGVGLALFLPFDGLVPLYVISAMFGLFQGGIVPAYAIIIREYFAPQEAGARVGAVIMATLVGMALGGWMSGWIFDVTGSYHAAFINGMGWNLLNLSIMGWLYWRVRRQGAVAGRAQPSAG
ncbi:MAG: MFS transporter [Acidovorax sp.]|uniref:MFS transporter n=1 Tax=Acidovorax sp. TaxID=1872122 RepID=UPI003919EEF3